MDGTVMVNTGTDPITYEMRGLDTAGDAGSHNAFSTMVMMFYEAPINPDLQTMSCPSRTACRTPTLGSYIGGINDGAFGLPGVLFTDGYESPPKW